MTRLLVEVLVLAVAGVVWGVIIASNFVGFDWATF